MNQSIEERNKALALDAFLSLVTNSLGMQSAPNPEKGQQCRRLAVLPSHRG